MDSTAESGHAPSESPAQPAPPDNTGQPDISYPTFCRAIFLLDPVFGGLRALLICRELLRAPSGSLSGAWLADTVAGLLVLVFGISATLALLLRKRWGIGLAAIVVLATLYSVGLGIWEVALQAAEREQAMFIVGAGCPIVLRIVLLILYLGALVRFEKWSRIHAESTALEQETKVP